MKMPNGYGSVYKLSGKRRKPFIVKKTVGYHIDEKNGKSKRDEVIIGYAASKSEGLQMLANYNNNPYDIDAGKLTFADIFDKWSTRHYPTVSDSSITAYNAAFNACESLHQRNFAELKLVDLQNLIDTSDKNYPTLKKIKILFNQLFKYAMQYDYVGKDYSKYVDIAQYRNKNPNKYDRNKFSDGEIEQVWSLSENHFVQTVLMLIYTGLRVQEFLALKKEDVHLDERYFDVLASKTENGIRKVPIAEKVYPFFKWWYEDGDSDYLIHNTKDLQFKYDNYFKKRFKPIMDDLGLTHTPHCCRHTCISLLATAEVDQTTIKKIVGHAGAMSLTERVYTHLDVKELVNAINKI